MEIGQEQRVPIDVSGKIVTEWLAEHEPPLETYLRSSATHDTNVVVFEYQIPRDSLQAAARRCAIAIAHDRLGKHPAKFFAWMDLTSGHPIEDAVALERAVARLRIDIGTRNSPRPDSHLCGLVAETLLRCVLSTEDRGLGLPVLFEGHNWSVTDPGGDCLVIYEKGGGLHFRLWESKSMYGEASTAPVVINEAAAQLHTRAAEYLGRYSPVAERAGLSPAVADLILNLEDLWLDDHPSKGAGVALAARWSRRTEGCYSAIAAILKLPAERTAGNFTGTPNFLEFAKGVREQVWAGREG